MCHMAVIEVISRFVLGGQLVFWGLNGFFNFYPIPDQTERLRKAVDRIAELPLLMPLVKLCEIGVGLCLILNLYAHEAALLISPIIVVICLLQLVLNFPKGWSIIVGLSCPLLIILLTR